jgi:hypothetical protein
VVCGGYWLGHQHLTSNVYPNMLKILVWRFKSLMIFSILPRLKKSLGKTAGKDLQAQKATYPSLWGLEKSRTTAQTLIDQAKAELASDGKPAAPLLAIADFIVVAVTRGVNPHGRLGQILENHVLIVAVIACLMAQASKLVVEFVQHGKGEFPRLNHPLEECPVLTPLLSEP